MSRVFYLMLLAAAPLLGGCTKGSEPAPAPVYLFDQQWHLTEAEGKPAPATTSLTLSSVDNLSSGRAWCNQYSGRFMLVPGTPQLTFSAPASTNATCSEQQLEDRYLTLLPQVRRYTINNRHLHLYDAEHPQPLLVFEVGK